MGINYKEEVKKVYPDAYAKHYASLSIYIESPLRQSRLSGIFHTEEEAWESAKEWLDRRIEKVRQKREEAMRNLKKGK